MTQCRECKRDIRLERETIPCQDGPGTEQYSICIECYWLAENRNSICPTICPILMMDIVQHEYINRRVNVTIPDTRDNWTRETIEFVARDSMRAMTRGQIKNGSRERRAAAQAFIRIMDEPIRAIIADSPNSALLNVRALLKSYLPDAYDMDDRSDWHRLVRILRWINTALERGAYRNDALTASPLDAFRGPVTKELSDEDILTAAYADLDNSAPESLIGRF